MNDPHVVALVYRVEHDDSVHYRDAHPIDHEEERFRVRISDGMARFELKEHHSTVDAALEVVDPYVHGWELDAALKGRPGLFELRFDGSEVEDQSPDPSASSAVELSGTSGIGPVTTRPAGPSSAPGHIPYRRSG